MALPDFKSLEGVGDARRGAGFSCQFAGAEQTRPLGVLSSYKPLHDVSSLLTSRCPMYWMWTVLVWFLSTTRYTQTSRSNRLLVVQSPALKIPIRETNGHLEPQLWWLRRKELSCRTHHDDRFYDIARLDFHGECFQPRHILHRKTADEQQHPQSPCR